MNKCKWLAYEKIQLQQPYSAELKIYRSHLPARNGIVQNLESMDAHFQHTDLISKLTVGTYGLSEQCLKENAILTVVKSKTSDKMVLANLFPEL